MAREQRSVERPAEVDEQAVEAPAPVVASTRFRATGTIPPVETATGTAPASASDRAFSRAMGFILPHEEVFARGHDGDERHVVAEHVKGDPGGTTKFGIDQASHRNVDVENLTREQAIAIYRREWDEMHLDGLPAQVAMTVFDVRVNGGNPGRWLQRAINQLQPPDAPKLATDGKLGPATIAAASAVDPTALAQAVIAQREQYYTGLATDKPHQFGQFLDGWRNRNRDLSDYVAHPESQHAVADETTRK
jgi:hypothetical protein